MLGRLKHLVGDDAAMRLGDLLFFELARYDLLNLVLQSQSYNGNVFRVDGWRRKVFATRRGKNWEVSVLGLIGMIRGPTRAHLILHSVSPIAIPTE